MLGGKKKTVDGLETPPDEKVGNDEDQKAQKQEGQE